MRNLAGREEATDVCRHELTRCGIEVVELEEAPKREVASKVEGKLGPFTFRRAWYYWCIDGPTPLKVAQELYEHPVGCSDIRVSGHCGCPAPEGNYINQVNLETGRIIMEREQREKILERPYGRKEGETDEAFVQKTLDMMNWELGDPEDGHPCVLSYHIDSELGLYLFVDALKRHGVVS
jgi:hypothetical protein